MSGHTRKMLGTSVRLGRAESEAKSLLRRAQCSVRRLGSGGRTGAGQVAHGRAPTEVRGSDVRPRHVHCRVAAAALGDVAAAGPAHGAPGSTPGGLLGQLTAGTAAAVGRRSVRASRTQTFSGTQVGNLCQQGLVSTDRGAMVHMAMCGCVLLHELRMHKWTSSWNALGQDLPSTDRGHLL